jgi:hypothetical protein
MTIIMSLVPARLRIYDFKQINSCVRHVGVRHEVFYFHLAGGHVEVVKLLLLYNADASAKTKNGMTPIDLAAYETESWKVLYQSLRGIQPKMPQQDDVVPVILRQWIPKPPPEEPDMGKKKKKGQKGKKGKKR